MWGEGTGWLQNDYDAGEIMSHIENYEEWREYVTKKGTNPWNWQHAGDWFFPTPHNRHEIYKGKFYHICQTNYELDMDKDSSPKSCTERCGGCGIEVPDGIKMIASLLSW